MKTKKQLSYNSLLLLITVLLFITLYVVACFLYGKNGFSHFQTFLNILIDKSGLICITCGMTCVMLTGGIDISVGSLVAMNCMLLVNSMRNGANCYVVCLEVLLIGILFGFIQGWFVSYMKIQPFIVTMAGMSFARGMTAVINTRQISITQADNPIFYSWANAKIYLPEFLGYTNKKGKIMVPFIYPAVIIALICVVVIFFFLRYSKTGRGFYAIGGNETSAAMMGLNTKKTKLKAYVLCSFLTAVGSICFCLNSMQGSVGQAMGLEMDAIASAVIGGTLLTGGVGNVFGSLVGVLINGTIAAAVKSNGKLLSSWANIVTAALLCFFIVLQSFFAYLKRRSK